MKPVEMEEGMDNHKQVLRSEFIRKVDPTEIDLELQGGKIDLKAILLKQKGSFTSSKLRAIVDILQTFKF